MSESKTPRTDALRDLFENHENHVNMGDVWDQMEEQETELNAANERIAELEARLETEEMRLAACGVVALADTPESAAQARDMHPDYRSASLSDVERRVDECIRLRAEKVKLREKCERLLNSEEVQKAWPKDGSKRAEKPSDTFSKAEVRVKFRLLLAIHATLASTGKEGL